MADRDPYTVALAATLRAECARAGWTIEEMAERSGLNYETLRRMLREERDISMDSLRRIANGLGVAPSSLMRDAESRMDDPDDADPHGSVRSLIDHPESDPELLRRLGDIANLPGVGRSRRERLEIGIRQARADELQRLLAALPTPGQPNDHAV
jgi:transcriptional regulator with XRE-family HTH domain